MGEATAYATVQEVADGFRALTREEETRAQVALTEAAVIIDGYNREAGEAAKRLVSCRMVRRQLGTGDQEGLQFPMGSTQGSMSALGYSQSWTMGNGSAGELYISRLEKKLLGAGNRIGGKSPLEAMTDA